MLKRILGVAAILCLSHFSSAQENGNKDFSSLNKELNPNEFNPISAAFFSRGAGFYTIFPKSRVVSFANYQTYAGTRKSGGTGKCSAGYYRRFRRLSCDFPEPNPLVIL